jgi:eukaryotic-like serine/threonine-protein kinase
MPGPYGDLRLSPDGRQLLFSIRQSIGEWHIWGYDWERDTMTRLTFSGVNLTPAWHPDGRHFAFASDRHKGMPGLYWMRADGAGESVRLTENTNIQWPSSFSPDGKRLVYGESDSRTGSNIWQLTLDCSDPDHPKPVKREPLLQTVYNEEASAISPDGHWLAYQSNESGRMEIYVQPFPGSGGKWQVSSGGGRLPVWSRNQRELFYLDDDDRIMAATYKATQGAFAAGNARLWTEHRIPVIQNAIRNFDPAPGGHRFVVLAASENPADENSATQLTILLNFFDEIRRLTH